MFLLNPVCRYLLDQVRNNILKKGNIVYKLALKMKTEAKLQDKHDMKVKCNSVVKTSPLSPYGTICRKLKRHDYRLSKNNTH